MTRWLVLGVILAACGGGGDDPPPSGTPMPTEVGTPIGDPVTATIGAEGGMLVSADGAATLIVPPGALATATELAIQPITNHAWTSPTGAYRLTPDGIAFAVPAELRLRYDPARLTGSAPGLLAIAYQTVEGLWAVLEAPVVDRDAREVHVALTHFTDYAVVEGMRLIAGDDTLEVNEATIIRLNLCFDYELAEPLMFPCVDTSTSAQFAGSDFVQFDGAEVNGVLDGDLVVGQVVESNGDGKWSYIAPREVPAANPVSFSVPVRTFTRQAERIATDLLILGGHDVWAGTATYTADTVGIPGFSNTKITHAVVTWTFDEQLGAHVPGGTVEYSETGMYDDSPNPPCQVSASYVGPIDPTTSSLIIDESAATYAGIGVELNVAVAVVDSCQGTTSVPMQLQWMPSRQGEIDFDTDTIDHDETSSGGASVTQHIEYHYARQ